MCVNVYVYITIHIRVAYIHTQTHTYICTYIHSYKHTYVLTYIHTYINTYIHTYIHTYNTETLSSIPLFSSMNTENEISRHPFNNMSQVARSLKSVILRLNDRINESTKTYRVV